MIAPLPAGALITCDLTTAGTSCGPSADTNGAIYRDITLQPTGSGVIDPFVRTGTNDPVEAGYNTSFRPLSASIFESQINTSPTFTHDLLLTAVPIVTIGGVQYREFVLDINQTNANPLLSLDNVKIFLSNTASATASTDPALAGGGTGLGTLIYNLDGNKDNGILLNYTLNSGSGSGDMFLDVPNSLFTGGFSNVYLWSQFGAQDANQPGFCANPPTCTNNDGFEEWAVQIPSGTPVPEPATMFLGGTGLVLFGYLARKRLFGGQRMGAI